MTAKKPIIVFYEPGEVMVNIDDKDTYLHRYEKNNKITLDKLLDKYDIDYDSFYRSYHYDENEQKILDTEKDVQEYIIDYINN